MYNRGLFHDWVPKPVQLLLIILFTIPLLTINGIYTANISDMVGSIGIMTEDLLMANYAATIGMTVVFPLLLRTKQYFKSKHILLVTFISLAVLSYVCASTDHPSILIAANFLLGGMKMFGLIEVILPIMFILSPGGDRARFYAVFYTLSIALSMVSGFYSAQLAYNYNWQNVYQLVIPVSIFCILLVLIFSHNLYGSKKVPIYQFDWISMIVLSTSLMLLNYVFSYGRVLNYFQSDNFQEAFIGFAILLLWFIQRQLTLKRPYLSLSVLKKKNVYGAILCIFLMNIFFATGSMQAVFTTGILKYSAQTNALLNSIMAIGAVFGGVFSFIWFKKKKGLKGIIFIGFSAFIGYHIILYFLFSPVIEINYLFLPLLLKGFGMVVLFISTAIFAVEKLEMTEMLSSVAMLVLFRSFIGPAFWGAVYSYGLYAGQMKHAAALVQRMDVNDPLFISRMNPTVTGSLAQGRSIEAAQSLGVQSMWGAVQMQATLTASKEIFGFIILAGALVLLFVLLFRFAPVNLRRLVKLRKRFRKREIIKDEEEMMAAVVA
ncbi:MAG: MFS transporter [Sphingobacteriaceae bacterium]|nr:MFS transporter [Sphingobacteriaceae bacterium]